MFGNSDAELVRRMKRGEAAAFAAFVDQFGPVVLRLARPFTDGCESDAEDITQDVFVALCRSMATFRGDAKLSTFVYRVAINHCLKFIERRRSRGQNVPIDDIIGLQGNEKDPAVVATHGELSSKINEALATLSEGHREVVVLHEMHGLTYSECATVLGIPVGTVKSRLFHAFGRLRTRLGDYVHGEDTDSRHSDHLANESPFGGAATLVAASIGNLK